MKVIIAPADTTDTKSARVPHYNYLKMKLSLIFSRNPYFRSFKYEGVSKDNKIGILVHGIDNIGIRQFHNFYPIADIEFYFNKLERELK